jgi:predicted ester cyclase
VVPPNASTIFFGIQSPRPRPPREKEEMDMTPEEMKMDVRRHFEAFVNQKHVDIADETVSPDFVDHDGPGGKPADREVDKVMMRGMHARYPDLHVTIEDMIAERDKVACRNVWRATDPASGNKLSFKGIVIWRFAQGKLVERWASVEPPR